MSGRCLDSIWKTSWCYLEGVWEVSVTGQVGTGQFWRGLNGTGQVGIDQVRTGQVGTDQVRKGKERKFNTFLQP